MTDVNGVNGQYPWINQDIHSGNTGAVVPVGDSQKANGNDGYAHDIANRSGETAHFSPSETESCGTFSNEAYKPSAGSIKLTQGMSVRDVIAQQYKYSGIFGADGKIVDKEAYKEIGYRILEANGMLDGTYGVSWETLLDKKFDSGKEVKTPSVNVNQLHYDNTKTNPNDDKDHLTAGYGKAELDKMLADVEKLEAQAKDPSATPEFKAEVEQMRKNYELRKHLYDNQQYLNEDFADADANSGKDPNTFKADGTPETGRVTQNEILDFMKHIDGAHYDAEGNWVKDLQKADGTITIEEIQRWIEANSRFDTTDERKENRFASKFGNTAEEIMQTIRTLLVDHKKAPITTNDDTGTQPNGIQPNGIQPNGIQPNGIQPNGIQPNGIQPNGIQPNGIQPNGIQPNGIQPNGIQPNGIQPNGIQPNGIQPNGIQPNGIQPNGIQPSGIQPNGVQPNGIQPNGIQPNGIQPSGTQPNGVQPNGRPPITIEPDGGIQPNGIQPNGIQPNGIQPSGIQPNGTQPNGIQPNGRPPILIEPDGGIQPNGTQPNGIQPNGIQPNGVQPSGTQPNGTQPNGIQPNGTQPNGVQPGGTQPNGVQPNCEPDPDIPPDFSDNP